MLAFNLALGKLRQADLCEIQTEILSQKTTLTLKIKQKQNYFPRPIQGEETPSHKKEVLQYYRRHKALRRPAYLETSEGKDLIICP